MTQQPEQKVITPLIVPVAPPLTDQFLILHSKDMEQTDIDLLKDYGRVILFENKVYQHIPIHTLDFDYMLLDLRRKEDRQYFQFIDEAFLNKCNVVSYCYSIEKEEDFHSEIGVDNILTKFPERQAFKHDFDRLLLLKKLSKPKVWLSCFKSALRLVRGDWK